MAVDLTRFLAPRSVALVGATDDLKKFPGRCLAQMIGFGFRGSIYPINPGRNEVRGLKCYPSVVDLPEPPDHVGICVAPEHAIEAVAQCGRIGVPFATVFSSGFLEAATDQGRELQARLVETARLSGVRLMGPNCNGTINFVERFAMTSSPSAAGEQPAPGNICVLSHSGGAGHNNLMWRALQLGLGLNYVVTSGNDADLDLLDFGAFALEQDRVGVILMLAERIGDGARFIEFARRAAELEKPIVMVKLGRTEAGSRAAASHTGALTGADEVCEAAFRQFGVIRVDDCHELYETAMLLRTRRWPKGRRACGIATTGGNIVLASDLGSMHGIEWPPYTDATQAKLREITGVGPFGNPTDTTTAAHGVPGMWRRALETILADENVDMAMPMLMFAQPEDVAFVQRLALDAEKPCALLWAGGERGTGGLTQRELVESGLPVFRDVLPCVKAMGAAARFGDYVRNRAGVRASRPADCDTGAARAIIAGKPALSEFDAHRVLQACGLRTVPMQRVVSVTQAVQAAAAMSGPVALKICSPDIAHKTEVDGVRLGCIGEAEVASAYEAIVASARSRAPAARIEGVLVQAMASPGIEIMLGCVHDLVFGPVVLAAHGGIHAELIRDCAYRVPPFDEHDAREMIAELRVSRLLRGGPRLPAGDIEALIDALVRLSWLAADCGDLIAELDINPVIVGERGRGLVVVDALIVCR